MDKSKLLVTADGFFGGCSDFGCWRESGKIDGLCSGIIMLSVRWQREETLAAFAVFGKTRGAKSPGGGVETRAGVLR